MLPVYYLDRLWLRFDNERERHLGPRQQVWALEDLLQTVRFSG